MTNEELDQLALRCLCGPLDQAESEALDAWLAGDAARTEQWLSAVAFAVALRDAATDTALALPPRQRRRAWRWVPIALAAAACLTILTPWFAPSSPPSPEPQAPVIAIAPTTGLWRGPLTVADAEDLVIPSGTEIVASWPDGTQVHLSGPTQARLALAQPSVTLQAGRVRALVAPQPGTDWTMAVPDGEVVVLGTIFTVESDAQHLAVEVEEGAVELRHPASGTKTITAGSSWRARGAGWRPDRYGNRARLIPVGDGDPVTLMIYQQPSTGDRYASASLSWSPADDATVILVPVRVRSATANTLLVIDAEEADGDVWWLGEVSAASLPIDTWVVLAFSLQAPRKIQYHGGDAQWDQTTVRRLAFSIVAADAVAEMGVPISAPTAPPEAIPAQ